jgi:hypothetical protein
MSRRKRYMGNTGKVDTITPTNGVRRKSDLRKQFDELVRHRLGRKDVVTALAGAIHTSASYISLMLDNKTPRRAGDGREYNMWRRLKEVLAPEEIAILERMEEAGD